MAKRFVRARPVQERLPELRERPDSGEIERFEPFGSAMTRALNGARFDPETGEAVWVEEDYCSPPLAMERAEVLDDYFEAPPLWRRTSTSLSAGGRLTTCRGCGSRQPRTPGKFLFYGRTRTNGFTG
jgi:hypothetical protein